MRKVLLIVLSLLLLFAFLGAYVYLNVQLGKDVIGLVMISAILGGFSIDKISEIK